MAELREEAIQLLQAGEMRQVQIARRLGVTEAAVSKWRKKLEEDGPQSLELHKATGRPPNLEKQRLVDKLKSGAKAAGFRTDIWTLERVDKMIQEEFGVSYNKNYIYNLLDDLDMRMPRPGPGGIIYEEVISIDFAKNKFQKKIKDYSNRFTKRHRK